MVTAVVEALKLPHCLVSCRAVLGTVTWLSFLWLQRSVGARYGRSAQFWLVVCSICQFHFPYYASRPLPNVFALIIVNVALAEWVHPNPKWSRHKAVFLLGLTISVFRCDVLILTAFVGLQIVFSASSLLQVVGYGMTGALGLISGVAVSYPVDSYFWNRPLWPEGEVFRFNVIENKSSNYGTSPFYWYFLIALPKMMLGSYLLFIASLPMFRDYARNYALPTLLFVLTYSILPHKEVRFIFYATQVFTIGAALTITRVMGSAADKKKEDSAAEPVASSRIRTLLKLGVLGLLLLSFAVSIGFAVLSSYNYPGGYAFARLHKDHPAGRVFIDTMTSMEGITRFGEVDGWEYVKEVPSGQFQYYIIGDHEDDVAKSLELDTKKLLFTIDGFQLSRFRFVPRTWVYREGS